MIFNIPNNVANRKQKSLLFMIAFDIMTIYKGCGLRSAKPKKGTVNL